MEQNPSGGEEEANAIECERGSVHWHGFLHSEEIGDKGERQTQVAHRNGGLIRPTTL